jgi:hypothetical protein
LELRDFALSALVIMAFVVPSETQERKRAPSKEQSSFNAEDMTVERPVSVSEDALQVLRRDEQVLRYLEDEGKSAPDLSAESFLASEVHLGGEDEIGLIVIGEGKLRGANVVTFWVFRRLANGYKLVLKTAAHDLTLQDKRWHRFRNIEAATPIARRASIVVYRFDGEQYKVSETKS